MKINYFDIWATVHTHYNTPIYKQTSVPRISRQMLHHGQYKRSLHITEETRLYEYLFDAHLAFYL
jgi:hypothetical protein